MKKNGKWGYVNTNGEEVIPCIYDSIGSFSEGTVEVKKKYYNQLNDKNL